ncbi:MAG: hypothetical protein IPM29_02380 [Planctomycetes bacterium]|nr:hypothetical protein [Planctomycetota bacterium]
MTPARTNTAGTRRGRFVHTARSGRSERKGRLPRPWRWLALASVCLLAIGSIAWFAVGTARDLGTRASLESAVARLDAAGLPRTCEQVDAWLEARFGPLPPDAHAIDELLDVLAFFEAYSNAGAYFDHDGLARTPSFSDRSRLESDAESYERLRVVARGRFRARFAPDAEAVSQEGHDAGRDGSRDFRAEQARLARHMLAAWSFWNPGAKAAFGAFDASRMIEMRIAVRLTDGDLQGAVADLREFGVLAEALHEIPGPTAQFVRAELSRRAITILRGLLPRAEEPRAIMAEAGVAPVTDAAVLALATASARELDMLGSLLAGAPLLASITMPELAAKRSSLARWIDRMVAAYEIASMPAADATSRLAELEEACRAESSAGLLWSSQTPWEVVDAELDQRRALLLTEAGAEAFDFHRRNGRWPSIEELATRPVDPVSGRELVASVVQDALELTLGPASWRLEPPR